MPATWIIAKLARAAITADYTGTDGTPSVIRDLMETRLDLDRVAAIYEKSHPEYADKLRALALDIHNDVVPDAYALVKKLEALVGDAGKLLAEKPEDDD